MCIAVGHVTKVRPAARTRGRRSRAPTVVGSMSQRSELTMTDESDHPGRGGSQPPEWPSLEVQLAASRVVPGTALERLVRDNQDFDRLRPEEADDGLPLPPWLRVYFHKQHPEAEFAPNDPTGGYPLALRDLYQWMVAFQDFPTQQGPEVSSGGSDGS